MITSKIDSKLTTSKKMPIKRQSQTNIIFKNNKAKAVADKIQNPSITTRELEKKYDISKATACREIQKELWDIRNKKPEIIEIAIENVHKWSIIFKNKLKEITNQDIQTIWDLNTLAQALKWQLALVNMIEWAWLSKEWNLPSNINIQIINNK